MKRVVSTGAIAVEFGEPARVAFLEGADGAVRCVE
jgi:hypothetical protein